MMNKIKFLMGIVVGLCIVNIGLMAFILLRSGNRHPEGPPGMPPEDRPRQLIIQKLNFDKAQVEKYDALISVHRETVHQLDRQIMEAKNKLYRTLVDGNGKDSLVAKLGDLQRQMELVHYNHFMDIKKICNTDQQGKYNELTKELAEYFRPPPPPPHR